MSKEKLKVLEMVAEGKVTPEEGVRLIEALGEAERAARAGRGRTWPVDIGDVRLPRIDLGHLGEVYVELKKSVVEGARKAKDQLKRSRAGRFFDLKDYPVSVERPEGAVRCKLGFDVRAGKLKLKGEDVGEQLLLGKVKHTPEEPVVITDLREDVSEVTLKHSLGRCLLRATPDMPYEIMLSNSAADSRLQLEQLTVDALDIENSAGTVVVVLGERAERVRVAINNNAGSVRLRVPDTHAVRVTPTGSLSTTNLEKLGLEPIDGMATSQDWEENPRGVDVVIDQNVASFKLDWKRSNGVTVGKVEVEASVEVAEDDEDEEYEED